MTEPSNREYWRSPFEDLAQDGGAQGAQSDEVGNDGLVGTPEEDTGTWDGRQSYPDTCAIRCQEFIIEQFTGREIDETDLVEGAQAAGLYAPGQGTLPQDTGVLLEMYDIPVNQYLDATTFDLANELAQGHKVIIGVDAGELIGRENPTLETIISNADMDGPDHAVVVSGIDTTDLDNPQVIVSDPGTGEAEAAYPMDEFLAAWRDSNFHMVATQEPPPEDRQLPEMVNFDYDAGHIAEVLGLPYEVLIETPLEQWFEMLEQLARELGISSDTPSESEVADTTAAEPNVPEVAPGTTDYPPADPDTPVVDPNLLDPTAPGPTIDPSLLDPSAPGPTVNPNLLNVSAPGPTIDPSLLDPAAPGPTIDPGLLDPSAQGPTVDPNLLDPVAPGPTVNPGFLDPNAPGLTVDPSILDPTAPGPNLDPGLLDPSTQGTAAYPEWFVEMVTNIQSDIDGADQETSGDWAKGFDAFDAYPSSDSSSD